MNNENKLRQRCRLSQNFRLTEVAVVFHPYVSSKPCINILSGTCQCTVSMQTNVPR